MLNALRQLPQQHGVCLNLQHQRKTYFYIIVLYAMFSLTRSP